MSIARRLSAAALAALMTLGLTACSRAGKRAALLPRAAWRTAS